MPADPSSPSSAPPPAAPDPAVPDPGRAAARRRANHTVTSLVIAIGAVLAVLAVVLLMFPQSKPVDRTVDVGASARSAAAAAGVPLAVPRPGDGWTVNVARWAGDTATAGTAGPTAGGDGVGPAVGDAATPANWYLAFVAPSGALLRFQQADAASVGRLVTERLDRTGTTRVGDLSWTVYADPAHPDGARAWIATDDGSGYLIQGTASDDEFRTLAAATAKAAQNPVRP